MNCVDLNCFAYGLPVCLCHKLPSEICRTNISKTASGKISLWPCNCVFLRPVDSIVQSDFTHVMSVHLSVFPSPCSSAWNYLDFNEI